MAGDCAPARPGRPGSCRSPAAAGGPPHAGCGRNRSLLPRLRKTPIAFGRYLNIAASRTLRSAPWTPSHPRVSTAAPSSPPASRSASSAADWFSASATRIGAKKRRAPRASGRTLAPNAFVRVAPDDTITVVIGKSEMGQGIYTGLAMALAEELDVDPARVKVEFAGADPAFNVPFMPIQFTGGSMSTSTTYTQLREAGARARAMLLAAAAQQLGRRCGRAHHRGRQGVSRLEEPDLRRAGRRGLAASGAGEGDAQGSGEVSLSRQAAKAPRRADESGRQREVRHRHARAGHAVRGHRPAARGRREARHR